MFRGLVHHALVAVVLFGLWVVLSGMLDALHLVLGAVSAVAVTAVSGRRLYLFVRLPDGREERRWLTFIAWHRVAAYLATLGWEILQSNFAVAKKVLGPLSALEPQVFQLNPDMRSELARVVLGYSIILTPGTTVLDVTPEGEFVAHGLDAASVHGTLHGPLQKRVRAAFEPSGLEPAKPGEGPRA